MAGTDVCAAYTYDMWLHADVRVKSIFPTWNEVPLYFTGNSQKALKSLKRIILPWKQALAVYMNNKPIASKASFNVPYPQFVKNEEDKPNRLPKVPAPTY